MDKNNSEIFNQLKAPIPADQLRWRVGTLNPEKTQGRALPYIDARVVQNRLDEVLGPQNWKNSYHEVVVGSRLLAVRCTLSLCIDGQWISKEDAAYLPGTHRDDASLEIAVKGVYSDSLKRAAVQWGLARYLYDFEAPMVDLIEGKLSSTPDVDQVLRAQKTPAAQVERAEPAAPNDTPESGTVAEQSTASTATPAPAPAPAPVKQEQKADDAEKPMASPPAPSPAPAPTANPPAPAQAPAPTKAPAPERDESAPVDETKYGVAAKADAPAAPTAAPAANAGAAEDGQGSPMFQEISKKIAKELVPAPMLLSYVQGPKGKEKLTPAEREVLIKKLNAIINGEPTPAAS